MTRRQYKWIAAALVALLIVFSVVRALSARKAQQEAVQQASVDKLAHRAANLDALPCGDGLAYEIERRDSHVGAQIRTRKLAVAGLPWIVEAATDSALDIEIADDLQSLVNSHLFSQLVMDLLGIRSE